MGEKIVVGPINKGLKTDRLPFVIDNDSFPTLINAYQWRGRIKRKRGTQQLGRLTRYFNSLLKSFNPGTTTQVLNGSGIGNLLTGFSGSEIQSNASIVPGSVTINDQTTSVVYTDTSINGTLHPIALITGATQANPCVLTSVNSFVVGNQIAISGVGGMTQLNGNTYTITARSGTTITINVDSSAFGAYTSGGIATDLSIIGAINYATGSFTISPPAADTINANFKYFPDLPVMGLEDLVLPTLQFPGTIAFDTTYSYNINQTFPYTIFDVSFYKNPPDAITAGYTRKTIWTPLTWHGFDYQQFWTTNYQGAMWATNGIEIPFLPTKVGMQYKLISSATAVGGPGTDVDFVTTNNHPFVAGDWVFINETNNLTGMNFETGFVLSSPAPTATTFRARFPTATIAGSAADKGIVQALTTNCLPDISSTVPITTKDCIRWYDGSPITSTNPPSFVTGKGWVNFSPPLSLGPYSISDLPPAQYYLAGARMIVNFKDRLLFFGPVIQTSAVGSQRYLQDTVIYSQNGTPFYTVSFPYDTLNPTAAGPYDYTPLLLPDNQTGTASAWWEEFSEFGGYIQAGFDQPINTVSNNEDVLMVGFPQKQARFVFTGNDFAPFNFYIINSELGASSAFSAINLDRGVITIGPNGIAISSQVQTQRIDLEIPDQEFQFSLENNGSERITAQRDFINEWIYFTYSSSSEVDVYPDQTLLFNYRDNSWAIFNESATSYGQFRKISGQAWDDLTTFTWDEWTDVWDSGEQTLLQPEVIAGNQQGFIMVRAEGTGEEPSGYIQAIDANSVVNSPHHNLDTGDYIMISEVLGTIGANVNGFVFSIANVTMNTFTLNPTVLPGTYLGGGVFTHLYVPTILTKQFPVSWSMMRKTRLGPQMYLFTKTDSGQITLQIYLSQNATNPYNAGKIVPDILSVNNSLVYSDILFTCPETNNIQTLLAENQAQIWHRMNTGLIGDTVQIGFTLSDEQMRNKESNTVEIELHSFILDVSPSQLLV